MRYSKYIGIILLFSFIGSKASEQIERKLDWQKPIKSADNTYLPYFMTASYGSFSATMPEYTEVFDPADLNGSLSLELDSMLFEPLPASEIALIDVSILNNTNELIVKQSIEYQRKQARILYTLLPFRQNPENGQLERLIYFRLKPSALKSALIANETQKTYTSNSVLKTGKWFKIKISQEGVYKLTYKELKNIGIEEPENIRIYGNGGKMLSTQNIDFRHDDLVENAIYVNDGGDGIFGDGDFILFFGSSPHTWKYDETSSIFKHSLNKFNDYSYYFLTSSLGRGKTIPIENNEGLNLIATDTISTFNDYKFHEKELFNLFRSGSEWYGEQFNFQESYEFNDFNFPNIIPLEQANIALQLLARSPDISYYNISVFNENIHRAEMKKVNAGSETAAFASIFETNFKINPKSNNINIKLSYDKLGNNLAYGFLNYIAVNARRQLIMTEGQLLFRDIKSRGIEKVGLFSIGNTKAQTMVWDISDITAPVQIPLTYAGGNGTFITATQALRQFIAFNSENALSPITTGSDLGMIENQDLHGLPAADFLIISHNRFLAQADTLAAMRRREGMTVHIVTPEQIYNEFSSGSADVSALRDYVKMFYDRADNESAMPKYLLLFGDGSFDNRSSIENGNTNYILTFQSSNSIIQNASFTSDDFFGMLDEDKPDETISSYGGTLRGMLDIGIGRLPVKTTEEADLLIKKIKKYESSDSYGNWRNMHTFISDDEDWDIHMLQANSLADYASNQYPDFNVTKIYMDAYKQIISSAGETSPDAAIALQNRVSKGTLILNYTGHGGIRNITSENIMNGDIVKTWENFDKLFLFVTASCEISRFDELSIENTGSENTTRKLKEDLTLGEKVLLHDKGGAVSLFSTTRLVYSNENQTIHTNFYKNLLANKQANRLGDISRIAKNASGVSVNNRNFSLLGDPTLRLAIPRASAVVSDSIWDNNKNIKSDTIKALGFYKVYGKVVTQDGNIDSSYNGKLYPVIYDKPLLKKTLVNHPSTSSEQLFISQENILYSGNVSVKNGYFEFEFKLPKDINYKAANGRISYYAENHKEELSGSDKNFIIGKLANLVEVDNTEPLIKLYMNDTLFINGGITNSQPKLLVNLFDDSGINTTGNGIGHDITAILDSDEKQKYILNDFYISATDDYRSGGIRYPLSGLTPGKHSITVKSWDGFNNSAEASIDFVVLENILEINELYNYPNPFSTSTNFVFSHNYPDEDLDITLVIYDLSGRLVQQYQTQIQSGGYVTSPIEWDGTSHGNYLDQGMYVYKVRVQTKDGQVVEKHSRLIISR